MKAIKSLADDGSIVIKNADKGSAVYCRKVVQTQLPPSD